MPRDYQSEVRPGKGPSGSFEFVARNFGPEPMHFTSKQALKSYCKRRKLESGALL